MSGTTISSGTTITVQPGVIIKFKANTSLEVNGTLNVQGTSSSLVYFTSFKDDVGGDTNGDTTSTAPTYGDWEDIIIGSGASSTFAGAVVRYGGDGTSTDSEANIYNNGGTLNLRYVDIHHSDRYCLRINANTGSTTITYSEIHHCDVGIYIATGTASVVTSTFYNITISHSAAQLATPSSTMTGNFWGGWLAGDYSTSTEYNSGPRHDSTNPLGKGADVSDYISYISYKDAYLADPDDVRWSPPGVNPDTRAIRVGSSTQYQTELNLGRATWNASSSGYVTLVDASTSTSSTWDMYVADIDDSSKQWAGQFFPSTTSTPHIEFNQAYMTTSSNVWQCVTTHELGHALGLGHSYGNNIMSNGPSDNSCDATPQLDLGAQDINDFNLIWSPSYFWDPYDLWGR